MKAPVVAIVQARMGSTRLPGKVLAPFGSSTLLERMFDRLRSAERGLDIWVATSTLPEDDAVAAVGQAAGVLVFRGSERDVLGRFARCVEQMAVTPRAVLRVCADRPFLCPVLVGELLDAYDALGGPDYVANNLPPSYPRGLDLELVTAAAIAEADRESTEPYDREHVTPFVYRRPDRYRLAGVVCPFGNFADVNLSLDTPEDYRRLLALNARLPREFDYRDVLNAVALEVA